MIDLPNLTGKRYDTDTDIIVNTQSTIYKRQKDNCFHLPHKGKKIKVTQEMLQNAVNVHNTTKRQNTSLRPKTSDYVKALVRGDLARGVPIRVIAETRNVTVAVVYNIKSRDK